MEYQILVSNKSGLATGEIIGVFKPDHSFSPAETMASFVASGGDPSEWTRLFSLVTGSDGSYEDMKHLDNYNEDGVTKKYFFNQPPIESQEFLELYATGQTERSTQVILSFIGER